MGLLAPLLALAIRSRKISISCLRPPSPTNPPVTDDLGREIFKPDYIYGAWISLRMGLNSISIAWSMDTLGDFGRVIAPVVSATT